MTDRFAWLSHPPLAILLETLNSKSEEARVVGGAVRNALLGEPVNDWDIATTASVEVVTQRCQAKGWKVVPTGIDHGTVTVVVEGIPFEVTTLREDLESDGRHAVVRFGRDFRSDALRRDFTINAMSLSADGTLHDYTGGVADAANRRIRFIGDPSQRIQEDYLRILRLFRFHAQYGHGPIDAEALFATIRERKGLAQLSRERIRHEMIRLIMAPGAGPVLAEMEGAGILLAILAGVTVAERFSTLTTLEASHGMEPHVARRLAALAVLTIEDSVRISEALRLSNVEMKRLSAIAVVCEQIHTVPQDTAMRILAYRFGKEVAIDAVLINWDHSSDPRWQKMLEMVLDWTVPKLPWSGRDIVLAGVAPGPAVGTILMNAEQSWIADDFCEDASKQKTILESAIAATVSQAFKAL